MRRMIATCAASFCPKKARIWFDDVKQLRDHGRDPAKMSRPRTPVQLLAQSSTVTHVTAPARIHFFHRRREQQLHALALQHFPVPLKRSRILCQIFVRPKLRRIHKDGCRNNIARSARAVAPARDAPHAALPSSDTNPSRRPAPRVAREAARISSMVVQIFKGMLPGFRM